jgi:hypothetical protein
MNHILLYSILPAELNSKIIPKKIIQKAPLAENLHKFLCNMFSPYQQLYHGTGICEIWTMFCNGGLSLLATSSEGNYVN